jgi:hypothetical protein
LSWRGGFVVAWWFAANSDVDDCTSKKKNTHRPWFVKHGSSVETEEGGGGVSSSDIHQRTGTT